MRFPMHDAPQREPQPAWIAAAKYACAALVFILLLAVVIYILVQGMTLLGVLTLLLLLGTGALLGASWWDIKHAYVHVEPDDITVVEYPLFMKKEQHFSPADIAAIENGVNAVGFTPAAYLTMKGSNLAPLFSLRQSAEAESLFTALVQRNQEN